MLKSTINMIISFFKMLKYPLYAFLIVVGLFTLLVFINVVILYFKGVRPEKGSRVRIKKPSIFKRIFYLAPKQYAYDIVTLPPDFFKYQGMVIYTGEQKAGKTISVVQHATNMLKEYPKAKCISNMGFTKADDTLNHWTQLIDYKNDIYGVVAIIDELQNWFSNNQSRNFPPEMLSVITQNRKNRRIILGTSQSFHLLAKSIRSQVSEVRECFTLAGCITFVRRRYPVLDHTGDVAEWKNRGIYFFVHTKELRESYNTWEVIESLRKTGFQEKDYLKENNVIVNNFNK